MLMEYALRGFKQLLSFNIKRLFNLNVILCDREVGLAP